MTEIELTLQQKRQVLMDGFNECMKYHTCGTT